MMDQFVSTVERIYTAATDPQQWSEVTDRIRSILGASGGCLIRHDPSTSSGEMRSIAGMSSDSGPAYSKIAYANLFAQRAGDQPAGKCMVDRELVTRSELLLTDFYADFLRDRDIHSIMSAFVMSHGGLRIAFGRPHSGGEWDAPHIEFLGALAPHLCRVAEVNAHVEGSLCGINWEASLVDRLVGGVLVVDASGKILKANIAAEEVLRRGDGLVSHDGRLEALMSSDTVALRRTIATTAALGPECPVGGTHVVRRRANHSQYRVVVVPVVLQLSFFADRRSAALVCVRDPTVEGAVLKAYLRTLFNLTQAEAAISVALVSAGGVQIAAEQCEMAVSTARKHLQHVFEKTNTHRQAELVRLVLDLKIDLKS